MSIKVTDFKWEKGKNDLEYIALLEKNLDAMAYKFRECAKVAREQYNKGYEKGRTDREKELAELPNEYSEKLWKLAYSRGRTDAIDEFKTDIINKIDFEEKWLMNCKSNNADTNIAFSALKTFANNFAKYSKERSRE